MACEEKRHAHRWEFLTALRSEDVVSGLAIDAAPALIYLWAFVLPTYGDISLLHMLLGDIVVAFGVDEGECFVETCSYC